MSPPLKTKDWFSIANGIDCIRLGLLALFFFFALTQPTYAIGFYIISQSLDAVDGFAARYFHQSSKLGAALDLAIDRLSFACLAWILAQLYSGYELLFVLLVSLDWLSHALHFYNSSMDDPGSHKLLHYNISLLTYYYDRRILGLTIFGFEGFLISLYLLYYFANTVWLYLAWFCLPFFVLKNTVHLVKLIAAWQYYRKSTKKT